MNSLDLETAIDKILSDTRILDDVHAVLDQKSEMSQVEVGDGMYLSIPKGVSMDVVNRLFIKEYYDIGFGTGYRVQVAIGGVQKQSHGVLYAKYCFATLYYNIEGRIITIDFHEEMR